MSGNLSRPDRVHKTAGVDAELWWDYQPGQRVMTREGIAGTVTAVEDGPYAGAEQYIVELDGDLGGGEYSPGELVALEGATAAKTAAKTAAQVRWTHTSDDARFEDSWDGAVLDPNNEELDCFVSKDEDDDQWHWEVQGRTRWLGGDCDSAEEGKRLCEQGVDTILRGGGNYDPFDEHTAANHTAADDYPVLGDILTVRPPLVDTIPVTAKKTAGWIDNITDRMNQRLPPNMQYKPGNQPSIDWCRFRRNERCMYPKELNVEATRLAGYAVWIPVDRGFCPRETWDDQKLCPVSEPGPNSGDPQAKVDATIPWEAGGQRGGIPGPQYQRVSGLRVEARYLWPDGREVSLREMGDMAIAAGTLSEKDVGEAFVNGATPAAKAKVQAGARQVLFEMAMRGELKMDSSPYEPPARPEYDPAEVAWMYERKAEGDRLREQQRAASKEAWTQWRRAAAKTYYHASPTRLPVGTVLTPRGGPANFGGGADSDWVYMTDSEGEAERWGYEMARNWVVSRIYLYEVEPRGQVTEDEIGLVHDQGWSYGLKEFRAEAAVVKKLLYSFDTQTGEADYHEAVRREAIDRSTWLGPPSKPYVEEEGYFDRVMATPLEQLTDDELGDLAGWIGADQTGDLRDNYDLIDRVIEERKRRGVFEPENIFGGQRGYYASLHEAGFEFLATWKDVRAKAKRIRSEGGVRIISASPQFVVGEIEGDTNLYETSIEYVPGTKQAALWTCGCAWANYSWGRSGRWKKYEGRMCSHALSLMYEAQARGMFGKEVREDAVMRRRDPTVPVIRPGDYRTKPRPFRVGVLSIEAARGLYKTAMAMTPEQAADYLMRKAKEAAPGTSALLRSLVNRVNAHFYSDLPLANAAHMIGLQYAVKTNRDRIIEKLEAKLAKFPDAPPEMLVGDVLRYTFAAPPLAWSAVVQDVMFGLEQAGYRMVGSLPGEPPTAEGLESMWQRGDPYSGLHTNWIVPSNKMVMELQFHTDASFNLKDKVLHKWYEEFRSPHTPLKRRQELWHIMTPYWNEIPIPEGALDWPNQRLYPYPTAARVVRTDPELAAAPISHIAAAMLAEGTEPNTVLAYLEAYGRADLIAEAMSIGDLRAKVRGLVRKILNLNDDGTVDVEGIGPMRPQEVLYPTYDPSLGLHLTDHRGSLHTGGAHEADVLGWRVAAWAPSNDLGRQTWENEVEHLLAIVSPPTGAGGPWHWDIYAHDEDEPWESGEAATADEAKDEAATRMEIMLRVDPSEEAERRALDTWTPGDEELQRHLYERVHGSRASIQAEADAMSDEGMAKDYVRSYQGRPVAEKGDQVYIYRDLSPNATKSGYPVMESWSGLFIGPTGGLSGSVNFHIRGARISNAVARYKESDRRRYQEIALTNPDSGSARGPHAYIAGTMEEYVGPDTTGNREISYYPDLGAFFMKDSRREYLASSECIFAGRKCWAVGSVQEGDLVTMPDGNPYSRKYERDKNDEWARQHQKAAAYGDTGTMYDDGFGDAASGDPVSDERIASMPAEDQAEYLDGYVRGLQAELKNKPEPALPETTGEDEEISGGDATASHRRHIEGSVTTTPDAASRDWLMTSGSGGPGPSDGDIAAQARRFLKEGMKAFTPAEQQALINEGDGEVTASNLDRLDITGTHYEALEAALAKEEEEEADLLWL